MKLEETKIAGNYAEKLFNDLAIKNGFKVIKSSRDEDMFDHIDFHVERGIFKASIEVKSEKKISRKDYDVQSSYLWLELRNVNGDSGWVYGKADYIAFQTGEGFLLVKTELLRSYIEDNVNFDSYVDYPDQALKRLYNRVGREDILTLISVHDLIKYNNERQLKSITKLV